MITELVALLNANFLRLGAVNFYSLQNDKTKGLIRRFSFSPKELDEFELANNIWDVLDNGGKSGRP